MGIVLQQLGATEILEILTAHKRQKTPVPPKQKKLPKTFCDLPYFERKWFREVFW